LPDGSIEFLGRLDRQMKIRGFRVELEEIEAALEKHQDIRQATAIVREDVPGDQRLIAYLVPVNGTLPPAAELRLFVQATLPDFMVPSAYVRMSALPLTPNGKVNRSALPRPARVITPPTPAAIAVPRTELESLIAGAWAEALRVEEVGLQDNFFDLGAHSLLIVQVQTRLQQLLNRPIPLIQFFRCPTVSALTSYLSEKSPDAADSRVADRAAARRGAMARRQRGRELAPRL
jgi:acyl carrier protein